MVQLKVLSGKMAGTEMVARRFPFRIGRGRDSDLRLEEDGVWDGHLELEFNSADGFTVTSASGALTAINGKSAQRAALRNGDCIELGVVKVQFWLAPARQKGLRIREWLTWAAVGLVAAAQIGIVYQMSR
jgi:pSer/pThr/pTyr-binding forkhead associated (FHA) protein